MAWYVLVVFVLLPINGGQGLNRGEPCTNHWGDKATCTNIYLCKAAVDAVAMGVPYGAILYVSGNVCGYDIEPLVCCMTIADFEESFVNNVIPPQITTPDSFAVTESNLGNNPYGDVNISTNTSASTESIDVVMELPDNNESSDGIFPIVNSTTINSLEQPQLNVTSDVLPLQSNSAFGSAGQTDVLGNNSNIDLNMSINGSIFNESSGTDNVFTTPNQASEPSLIEGTTTSVPLQPSVHTDTISLQSTQTSEAPDESDGSTPPNYPSSSTTIASVDQTVGDVGSADASSTASSSSEPSVIENVTSSVPVEIPPDTMPTESSKDSEESEKCGCPDDDSDESEESDESTSQDEASSITPQPKSISSQSNGISDDPEVSTASTFPNQPSSSSPSTEKSTSESPQSNVATNSTSLQSNDVFEAPEVSNDSRFPDEPNLTRNTELSIEMSEDSDDVHYAIDPRSISMDHYNSKESSDR